MKANSAAIPVKINIALTTAAAGLCGFFYLGLPLLLPGREALGLLLIPFGLLSNSFWALVHEALHGKIHADRRMNNAMGRLLCILFGCPFQVLRFGHLMHHRFNRSPIDRTEVFGSPDGPSRTAVRLYYFKLLGGLYALELLATLLALGPKSRFRAFVMWVFGEVAEDGRTMKVAAEGQLLEQPGYGRLQADALATVILFAISFWLYGANAWMLALALATRGFLVSFFDNAYHYGNPVDDHLAGYNLKLPLALERLLLNFNLHATHHRYPRAPWTAMPAAFAADREVYHHPYLPAALRQLRGMIGEGELRPE